MAMLKKDQNFMYIFFARRVSGPPLSGPSKNSLNLSPNPILTLPQKSFPIRAARRARRARRLSLLWSLQKIRQTSKSNFNPTPEELPHTRRARVARPVRPFVSLAKTHQTFIQIQSHSILPQKSCPKR